MSSLDEVRHAWRNLFPGEELPDVWLEEHILVKLTEHRNIFEYHKHEAEKEEFIVRHLEEMLAVTQLQTRIC